MVDVLGSLIGGIGLSGNTIGAAVVRLRLDADDYKRQLATAHGQTDVAAKSMGTSWANFGAFAKAGALGAGAAILGIGAASIKAASDQGEALNKSRVIFGQSADDIEAWARTGAEAFGLSTTASLDAAASFGQIVQNAGFAVDKSADMSKALVQLAGDMASFNNTDPSEMLDKLRSGLAGEVEPLRRFGVDLSAATVEQEAFRSGIAKTGEELTAAQKIQARYNLILEDTTKQQGDFARTSDTLPNQLRSLKAEFINIAATLGESLLPIAVKVLGVFGELAEVAGIVAEAFNEFGTFTPSQQQIDATENYRRELQFVSDLWQDGKITGAQYEENLRAIAVRYQDSLDPIVHMEQAERFLQATTEETGEALDKTGKAADKAKKEIIEFAGKTGEELKDWRVKIEDSFDSFTLALEESDDALATTQRGFVAATKSMLGDARALAQAMREISQEEWVNQRYVAFLSEQGPQWLIGFSKLTEEQQHRAQEAWKITTEKTDKAKESLDKITGVLDKMDKGESRHKVIIEYQYEGFDPTKPGMAGTPGRGRT